MPQSLLGHGSADVAEGQQASAYQAGARGGSGEGPRARCAAASWWTATGPLRRLAGRSLQIQANRLNSQKSTGPRSAEGKAASSKNALKSGIDSESQIIRGEDPAALDALAAQYLLDHQPQSASERALVDILIDSEWTLRRLRKTEAQLWEYDLADIENQNTKSYNRDNRTPENQVLGCAFERRRDSLQRAFHRTLQDLRQLQGTRQPLDRPAAPPEAHKPSAEPPAAPPLTPSSQKPNPEIGFVPENPAVPPARLVPAQPCPTAPSQKF